MQYAHQDITKQIIGAAFEVYRVLGYGFLEKVYQRAMQVELISRGLKADLESRIKVMFKNHIVGDYSADLFIEERVVVDREAQLTVVEVLGSVDVRHGHNDDFQCPIHSIAPRVIDAI